MATEEPGVSTSWSRILWYALNCNPIPCRLANKLLSRRANELELTNKLANQRSKPTNDWSRELWEWSGESKTVFWERFTLPFCKLTVSWGRNTGLIKHQICNLLSRKRPPTSELRLIKHWSSNDPNYWHLTNHAVERCARGKTPMKIKSCSSTPKRWRCWKFLGKLWEEMWLRGQEARFSRIRPWLRSLSDWINFGVHKLNSVQYKCKQIVASFQLGFLNTLLLNHLTAS